MLNLKKTIITMSLSLYAFSVSALDFMGKNINEMNEQQLHSFLTSNGAKRKSTNGLVSVYNLKGSKIPMAYGARLFVNENKEFVGLQILFPYDSQSYINLRKILAEKYTLDKEFSDKYFFKVKTWKLPDNTSIEYNADLFKQIDLDGGITGFNKSNMFMFYRNDARRNQLINNLKNQQYEAEKDTLKNVF